ncbi:MAG TPA: EAL domain-containing protein [Dongiaceae bacterium]|nr:EAL domain-containing protein [Dongiaceae bacterium]
MSTDFGQVNRRILLVDDNEAIHQDFRKILTPSFESEAALAATKAALFGEAIVAQHTFHLDSAFQGQESLEMVRRALAVNMPYAMAFIDMRMPPGWDGLETIEHIWEADPRLQIALCTAYSDYSWEDLAKRFGSDDRLLILKKPFDNIEICQMANALTSKWEMTKQAAFKMSTLEQAVEERTRELTNANIIVQNSPVILYRLRGEPSFPLIYISHNITKLGHDRAALLISSDWIKTLIHPDDQAKIGSAMARILERDAEGASIDLRLRTGEGTYRFVENRYVPVRDGSGRLIEVEGIIIDVTERKAAEEKIALLARTDVLTGLANRAVFLERIRQAFAAAQRGAMPFGIFYVDLDHFKPVNDTYGHAIGDLLLQEVAKRLRNCTRESDLVARLGGDEFAILQGEMSEPANAGMLAARVQAELALPYLLNGNDIRISASIGICPYVSDISDADSMLQQADLALYRSKEDGRNCYRFHSLDLDQQVQDRAVLAAELRVGIDRHELELYYQPQIELSSGRITGMEALVRWRHPVRGLLEAKEFISVAEKVGLAPALGRWVLDQACRQLRLWRDSGLSLPVVAINLSFFELKNGDGFVHYVIETTEKWGLTFSDLEFDVTEATLAQLTWTHNEVLPALRQLGIRIAIDDFGSEYSSFEYVRTYRVNDLKIAQSFIRKASVEPDMMSTVRAIVGYARDIGVGVIAQGVETTQQGDLLASGDPTAMAQGYLFSRAVDVVHATELLHCGRIPSSQWAENFGTNESGESDLVPDVMKNVI